jgi:hypothetical protein
MLRREASLTSVILLRSTGQFTTGFEHLIPKS